MLLRPRPEPQRAITVLFSLTALLSACLVFVIAPMVGKALLPDFGGGASVWAGVMVFFQLAVLAGCILAYLAIAWLGLARAAALLIVLGAIGALLAPASPRLLDLGMGPLATVVLTLAGSYGPAVVALASATALLQHWYIRRMGQASFSLHAVNNAGSLLGLAIYPIALEPLLGVAAQGGAWRAVYLLWLAGLAACAAVALTGPPAPGAVVFALARLEPPPSLGRRLRWVVLSAIPASLLLGVTQHLTFDLAPAPVLWTLPLAIYLLSIVAALAWPANSLARGRVYQACAIPPLVVLTLLPAVEVSMPGRSILMHLVAFAGCAMLCHGRLAELRPGRLRLPEFCVFVASGAALGGLFNALAAPLLFDRLTEYPLMMTLCAVVARPLLGRRLPREVALLPALLLLGLVAARAYGGTVAGEWLVVSGPVFIAGILACAALALGTTRLGMACVCAVGLVLPLYLPPAGGGHEVYASRDFYGPLRVSEVNGARLLLYGADVHAVQWRDPARADHPTGFASPAAGIGRLLATLRERARRAAAPPLEMVVVGLGAGGLACTADADTHVAFVEMDPGVLAMARTAFSYLAHCGAPPVTIGDGRANLTARADASLDLIVLKPFAAYAMPAHLLTAEAIRTNLAKLRPGGAIAINMTHALFDLAPVVAASGAWSGATVLRYRTRPAEVDIASDWAAIVTDAALIDALTAQGWVRLQPAPAGPVWYDDKWDLAGVLSMFALR